MASSRGSQNEPGHGLVPDEGCVSYCRSFEFLEVNLNRLAVIRAFKTDSGQISTVLSLRVLAGDTTIYLAGSAVIGLGNVVLVPLYTRYLAPAEFGVYALLDITVLVVVTLTQLGLSVSYLRWFAGLDSSQHGELVGSTLLAGGLAAGLGGAILALAVAGPLGQQFLHVTDRWVAWTLLPVVLLENIQGLMQNDLRARRRSVVYSVTAGTRLLSIIVASLWFVVVQHQGVLGIFLGRMLGDGISVLLLLVLGLRSLEVRYSWRLINSMVRYGLPLVISGLAGMMLDATGRYFLGQWSTLDQLGYYGAAVKIGNIFQVVVNQPLGLAWGGLMFQIPKLPNARLVFSKLLAYVFVLSLSFAAVAALLAPALFAIFASPAYLPAVAVFPVILLVRGMNVMEYPAAIGIYLGERTKQFAAIYLVGLATGVLCGILLVPAYGVFGAAWAWFVGWTVTIVLMAWRGQVYYPLEYDWKLMAAPVLLWVAVLLTISQMATGDVVQQWPTRLVLVSITIIGAPVLVLRDMARTRTTITEALSE